MTRMLVVVRSAEDAAAAVAGGADALVARLPDAAGSQATVCDIATAAAGRCPLGLWCPVAMPDSPDGMFDAVFVQLQGGAAPRGRAAFTAVLPLDGGLDAMIATAAERGFGGVVFGDGVQPRRLLQRFTITDLDAVVREARARQLAVGFAGLMENPDIPRLLALAPDILVLDELVREPALPSSPVSPVRMRFVRALVPPVSAETSATSRPLGIGNDRIFVRDWTVSIHVGAYAHERAPQRARFSVEVEVAGAADRVIDLRNVVTYDLITDAISRATAGHVDLVETLAEDVAAAILSHPRTVSVDVTVEKLDLGPGTLGCRIVRGRAP